jgi:hypothetical protein
MPLMGPAHGSLMPGQYQIPFSFTLAPGLPGVFYQEAGNDYRCGTPLHQKIHRFRSAWYPTNGSLPRGGQRLQVRYTALEVNRLVF